MLETIKLCRLKYITTNPPRLLSKTVNKNLLVKASVLDALSSHIAVVDENGVIQETNLAWDIFALNNNGNISKVGQGMDYFKIINDLNSNEAEKLSKNLRDVINGDLRYFYHDYPCHSPDEQRWYTMRITTRIDVKGAVITHTNITDRVLAETKLKEQELALLEYAKIVNESLNEIYVFDAESFKFIDVNKGGCMNTGYSLEELRMLTPVDIKPEFDRISFEKLLNGCRDLGEAKIQFETYHRRKDGSFYPVEVSLQKSFYMDRDAFLAIIMDVSERKESEQKLMKNEREFRSLAENAPYHFIKLNKDFIVEYINRGGFGLSADELIGQSAFDIIQSNNEKFVRKNLNSVFESGKPVFYETTRILNDKTSIVLGTQVGPVKNNKGDVVSLIVIIRDITEESKYKEELESVNQELTIIDEINRFSLDRNNTMDELIKKILGLLPRFIKVIGAQYFTYDKEERTLLCKHQELDNSIAKEIKSLIEYDEHKMTPILSEGKLLYEIIQKNKIEIVHGVQEVLKTVGVHANNSSQKKISEYLVKLLGVKSLFLIPLSIDGEVFALMTMIANEELTDFEMEKVQRFMNGFQTVLGQKHTRELVEESELRYKALFESINEGFVLISPKGVIQMTNPKFRELLGYGEADLLGMEGKDILKGILISQFDNKMRERREGISETYETTLRKYNGEKIWVEINASPRFDSTGEFIGEVSLIKDISDRKRKEVWSEISSNITQVISSEDMNLQEMLSYAQKELSKHMNTRNFYVCLSRGDDIMDFIYFEDDNSEKVAPFQRKKENGLCEQILKSGEPMILNEGQLVNYIDEHGDDKSIATIRSWVGAPLISKGQVVGVIVCKTYEKENKYNQFDLDLVHFIGQQLGVYIEKVKALEDKERLINLSIDLISIAGSDGYFKYVNPAFTEVLGYSKEELLSRPFISFVHPDDILATDKEVDNLNSGNNTINFINRYFTKDGNVVWLSWIARPIVEDGLYYCICRDISYEREIQNKIEESEKKYRGIFEGMKEGILYSGPEGKIIEVNPGLCNILGYSRDELIGQVGYDLLHDESTGIRLKQKLKYRMKGNAGQYEATFRTKLNDEIIAHVSSTPDYDKEGKFVGVLSIIMDITENKRAELESLELKEEFTRQLKLKVEERTRELEESQLESKYQLDTMNESALVSVTDINGVITYANDKFCKVSRYLPEELIGKTHRIIKSDNQSDDIYTNLWQTITQGKVWNGEIQNKAKDGSFFWADTTIVPFFNTKGKIDKYVSVRFDISQQKIQQQQLIASLEKEQELNELKSRFVATASHQFRTPLSVIQSKLAVLAMQENSMGEEFKPKFRAVFSTVQEQIKRMTNLMNEVLILGKINAGNISVNLKSVDLRVVCDEIISHFNIIYGKSIIKIELTGKPFNIEIDTKLFENSISNFISNAIKYSPDDTDVILKLNYNQEELLLSICDKGIGVPVDELDHLFEPFYRASNVNDVPGTGLGTSIAKEYLELIGADISVKSEIGVGTDIIVRFKSN